MTSFRIFILLFLGIPFFSLGQSNLEETIIDSMVQEANNAVKAFNYEEAINIAETALRLSGQSNYSKGQADSYVQIGRANKGQENFEEALFVYKKAYDLRREVLADSCGAAEVLNNMVSVLDEQFYYEEEDQLLDQALRYSQTAEQFISNPSDCAGTLMRIYTNQANLYDTRNEIDKAISSNRKGLALFSITQDTAVRIIGEYGLAKRLIKKNRLDSARIQLESTLALSNLYTKKTRRDTYVLGGVYEAIGVVALNSVFPEKALLNFKQAEALYNSIPGDFTRYTYLYFNIARAHELEEDYIKAEKAYEAAKKFHQSEDFFSKDFYEMLETQEILMYTKEEQRKEERNLFYALLALVLISISLLIAVSLIYKKEKSNNSLKEKHYQLKHDIVKNGLITINNHIIADLPNLSDNQNARKAVLKIRKMSKRILTQIGYEDTEGEEVAKLKFFVKEMHHRAAETAMMEVENYSYLDEVEDYPLSKHLRNHLEAIIIEAFTNIHKYADCQTASISFSVDENGLSVLIQDDGKGCDLKTISRSGLNSISQRTKALNGSVFFDAAPGKGFSIKINIARFPEKS